VAPPVAVVAVLAASLPVGGHGLSADPRRSPVGGSAPPCDGALRCAVGVLGRPTVVTCIGKEATGPLEGTRTLPFC